MAGLCQEAAQDTADSSGAQHQNPHGLQEGYDPVGKVTEPFFERGVVQDRVGAGQGGGLIELDPGLTAGVLR